MSFSNLSIKQRILATCAIPLVALVVVASFMLHTAWSSARAAADMQDILSKAQSFSNVIHELQRERGQSAGYIGSGGTSFADTLPQRRAATDTAFAALEQTFAGVSAQVQNAFGADFTATMARYEAVSGMRARVDARDIRTPDMAAVYTGAINEIIDTLTGIKAFAPDGEFLSYVEAYLVVIKAKEAAGLERAAGAVGFGIGTFSQNVYTSLLTLQGVQDNDLATFARLASPAAVEALGQELTDTVTAPVEVMREAAKMSAFGGDVSNISGADWFAATTARIDAIKRVEDALIESMKADAAQLSASARNTFMMEIGALLLVVLGSVAISWKSGRAISVGISRISTAMTKLADQDFNFELPDADKTDEVGGMARAVAVFRDNARERQRLESQSEEERHAQAARQQRVDGLIASFRSQAGEMLDAVGDNTVAMQSAIDVLNGVADSSRDEVNGTSAASDEASSNVQTVAAATEELSSSIEEISRQVVHTNEIVDKATHSANLSSEKVVQLAAAAQQIGAVVSLIQDIAEQTNLLALNATIEAARAGEMGKGFAVVASEVKSLANQTAKATEEISSQISGIQGSTSESADAIRAIAETMSEVQSYTNAIAAAVEEQGSATAEISRNITEAAHGTSRVSEAMISLSQGVDETSQSAGQVQAASGEVSQRTASMRRLVDQFLGDVAAA